MYFLKLLNKIQQNITVAIWEGLFPSLPQCGSVFSLYKCLTVLENHTRSLWRTQTQLSKTLCKSLFFPKEHPEVMYFLEAEDPIQQLLIVPMDFQVKTTKTENLPVCVSVGKRKSRLHNIGFFDWYPIFCSCIFYCCGCFCCVCPPVNTERKRQSFELFNIYNLWFVFCSFLCHYFIACW